MNRRAVLGVVVLLAVGVLGLASCGEEAGPPAWPELSKAQHDEAKRLGVPVRFENDLGVKFVLIPGGTFVMGAPQDEEDRTRDEGLQRAVTLRPFYMAVTEVTNARYRRFNPDHSSGEGYDDDAQPVVGLSHEDATAFVDWLSTREGGAEYCLPSEAQWEYACRAGTTTRYWSGDTEADLARVGWYEGNSDGRLHPVGERPANPFGLYDMHGNVWEWCEDSYDGAIAGGLAWRGVGPSFRVLRGGGWKHAARWARSAYRAGAPSAQSRGLDFDFGFRPVRPCVIAPPAKDE